MDKNLPNDSFLQKHRITEVTSVFPPTTAAAMTVFYSGLPPIVNGWLSSMYYFEEFDKVVSLYRNQDFYSGEILKTPPVAERFNFVSVYEQIEKMTKGRVKATELSPFNQSKMSSINDIYMKIKKICAVDEPQFILSYWPEPDAIMHRTGTTSTETKEVLCNINSVVEKLSSELKDTLIIVTADHGHIDLEEEIYIDEYPELSKMLLHPLSFEDRVVSVFVKPRYKEDFPKLLNELFPSEFMVLDKDTILKKQLFGVGSTHHKVLDFIGDYVVIAIKKKSLRQHMDGKERKHTLLSSHAGLCADEMRVPLILIENK